MTVAVIVALTMSMNWVLGTFGLWAIFSGILQLAAAVRRWKTNGGQWAMIRWSVRRCRRIFHRLGADAGGAVDRQYCRICGPRRILFPRFGRVAQCEQDTAEEGIAKLILDTSARLHSLGSPSPCLCNPLGTYRTMMTYRMPRGGSVHRGLLAV